MNGRNVWIIAGAIVLAGVFIAMAPTIRAWFVMRQIEETFEGPAAQSSGNPIERAVGLTFKECHDREGIMANFDGEPVCTGWSTENPPPIPKPLPTSVDQLPTEFEACKLDPKGKWERGECVLYL